MSDEQDHKLEAKSDYVADASSVSTPDIDAAVSYTHLTLPTSDLV